MYISTCRVALYEVYGRKKPITKNKRNSTVAGRTPVQSNYSFSSRLSAPTKSWSPYFVRFVNRQNNNVRTVGTRKLRPALSTWRRVFECVGVQVKMVQVCVQVSIQAEEHGHVAVPQSFAQVNTWTIPYSPRLQTAIHKIKKTFKEEFVSLFTARFITCRIQLYDKISKMTHPISDIFLWYSLNKNYLIC